MTPKIFGQRQTSWFLRVWGIIEKALSGAVGRRQSPYLQGRVIPGGLRGSWGLENLGDAFAFQSRVGVCIVRKLPERPCSRSIVRGYGKARGLVWGCVHVELDCNVPKRPICFTGLRGQKGRIPSGCRQFSRVHGFLPSCLARRMPPGVFGILDAPASGPIGRRSLIVPSPMLIAARSLSTLSEDLAFRTWGLGCSVPRLDRGEVALERARAFSVRRLSVSRGLASGVGAWGVSSYLSKRSMVSLNSE